MTYRELIEICYNTSDEECCECAYKNECEVYEDKTGGGIPATLYNALNIDLDAEIEVEE